MMIGISYFLVLIISGVFNLLGINENILIIPMIFSVSFVIVKYLKFSDREKAIILIVFLVLNIMVLIDLYYSHIIKFVGSGSDTESFFSTAVKISDGFYKYKDNVYGGLYTKWISILYSLSRSRLWVQYSNTIFSLYIQIIFFKILNMLGVKNPQIKYLVLSPIFLINSSILLREIPIIFFSILSFYFFTKFLKYRKNSCLYLSYFISIPSMLLHSGMVSLPVSYTVFLLIYVKETSIKRLLFFSILTLGIIIFLKTGFSNILLYKFKNLTTVEDLYEVSTSGRGGSQYLVQYDIDTWYKLIFFLPLKVVYFLFSPMPWDWRGIRDVTTFFIDSTMYIYLMIKIIKGIKRSNHLDVPVPVSTAQYKTILSLIITSFLIIFSIGINNSGTALRHRNKILVFLVLLSNL